VRTFALVALLGTLAASAGDPTWTVPVGLAAVAAMLIVAYSREPAHEDPGTTTVVAALVCYLLGVLAGVGEPALAGALAIGVTALLYFKPEIEGVSTALKRHEQVSILQFLVVTFIVLPILPDRGYGPYAALNPRNIWLMVVLVSGIGLASYVALRAAGSRHGVLMTGILSGLLSSTAATVLYARRSRESAAMERLAFAVVPLANLVPLVRIAVLAAVVAPALLAGLAPLLGAALAAGLGVAAFFLRGVERGDAPVPESANPAEMGTALRFGAVYAIVLLAAAWLADVAGHRGLYAAALAAARSTSIPSCFRRSTFQRGRRAGARRGGDDRARLSRQRRLQARDPPLVQPPARVARALAARGDGRRGRGGIRARLTWINGSRSAGCTRSHWRRL
jgi:uncharacterized membrane protein (DUF4010 family)